MNRVVEIIVNRDGVDREYAESLVAETRDELISLDDPFEAEDVIIDYLGLEPDYLEDILNF